DRNAYRNGRTTSARACRPTIVLARISQLSGRSASLCRRCRDGCTLPDASISECGDCARRSCAAGAGCDMRENRRARCRANRFRLMIDESTTVAALRGEARTMLAALGDDAVREGDILLADALA